MTGWQPVQSSVQSSGVTEGGRDGLVHCFLVGRLSSSRPIKLHIAIAAKTKCLLTGIHSKPDEHDQTVIGPTVLTTSAGLAPPGITTAKLAHPSGNCRSGNQHVLYNFHAPGSTDTHA